MNCDHKILYLIGLIFTIEAKIISMFSFHYNLVKQKFFRNEKNVVVLQASLSVYEHLQMRFIDFQRPPNDQG